MSLLDGLRHRLYVLRHGEAYSLETDRELRFHVELTHLAYKRDTIDAELRARKTLGNATYYREEVRAMTPLSWIDRIRQDAGYAWRGLLRTPAFTLTVIATLGLGIGVNAAMYSFLDRVFVRPPAGVVGADAVRRLYLASPDQASRGVPAYGSFTYGRVVALRERLGDTIPVAGYSPSGGTLIRVGESLDSVRQTFVTPEYFGVLRLQPTIGRFFAAEESVIADPRMVAVISEELWRRSFAASPSIIGRVIELKTRRFTVIGVAPRDFTGVEANRVDIWLPMSTFPVPPSNGRPWYQSGGNYFRMIARVETPALMTKLTAAGTAALRNNPLDLRPDTTLSLLTGPLTEAGGPSKLDSNVAVSARIGAVAFIVLLIAYANVANMLMLRASSRRREIAVRRALGVSTPRLYGQLITESVLLGLLSSAVALLFAMWAGTALRRLLLPNVHWATAAVDMRVTAVTIGVAFVIGCIVGIFPAAMSASVRLSDALKLGAKHSSGGRSRRVQTSLLVLQAALSVILLVGAGLFVRSFDNVRSIDLGYDPDGLLTVTSYVQDKSREPMVASSFAQMAERLRARPGVVAAAMSANVPMAGNMFSWLFVPGNDSAYRHPSGGPTINYVTPGYFEATGVRLVAGRGFTAEDRAGAAPVIVVDARLASALWPGRSALGQCLRPGTATAACATVVGVVEGVQQFRVIESTAPQYYLPSAQHPGVLLDAIVVRAEGGAVAQTLTAMRNEVRTILPDQSDWAVRTMGQILEPQMRPWRMGAILFAGLGLLALVVAAIGIYGVVAYSMSQRSHEMGVRIALGAQAKDIVDLVLASGLRVVIVGIVLGIGGALLLGRLVASQLFGVVPNDPSILIGAAVTMCAIAGAACLIPGWRAARVDPVTSLRSE
jgi:predicted permease